jgi:hypothetical protein
MKKECSGQMIGCCEVTSEASLRIWLLNGTKSSSKNKEEVFGGNDWRILSMALRITLFRAKVYSQISQKLGARV